MFNRFHGSLFAQRVVLSITLLSVIAYSSAFLFVFTPNSLAATQTVAQQTSGRILLQVQSHGEAWYVFPKDLKRYYLGRPADAFSIMRTLSMGITNADLAKIPESTSSAQGDLGLRQRLSGRILLQVQSHGEAWYVFPGNLKRYYLGRPADAFAIMRNLGLGITNVNLTSMPTGALPKPQNVTPKPQVITPPADTQAPVIALLGSTPVTVEIGTAYVDAGATASDNRDGNISANIAVTNPVNTSIVGSYTVSYNTTDAAGNHAVQVSRTVNVVDTQAPVITLLGSNPASVQLGTAYVDAGATASDNYEGNISSRIVVSNPVTNTVGTYTVTYNVTDSSGNSAAQVTRTVNVVDAETPVITLLGNNPVTVQVFSTYTDAGATAFDNNDGNLTPVVVNPVNKNVVGSYAVTYNVTDSSGNHAVQVTRTVNVVDTQVPVITRLGQDNIIVTVGGSYTDAGATVTDNYNSGLSVVTVNPVNTAVAKKYTVTYNVSDASGNAAVQQTRTVSVVTAPNQNNKILNPSFRDGTADTATNWNQDHWTGNTGGGVSDALSFSIVSGEDDHRAAKITYTTYLEGDAKWFFDSVTVNPGQEYTYSEMYQSDVPTTLYVFYQTGTTPYTILISLPATGNVWTALPPQKFIVPADATSLTIAHSLQAVGQLTIDNTSLINSQITRPEGVVSLTFDDGWLSHIDAGSYLKNKSLQGTFYIITNTLDDINDPYMDLTQVTQLHTDGHEIGGHTMDHCDLVMLNQSSALAHTYTHEDLNSDGTSKGACAVALPSPSTTDTAQAQIQGSYEALKTLFGPYPTFAYPYGEYAGVETLVQNEHYAAARSVDPGFNPSDPAQLNLFALKEQDILNTTTLADVQGWVNQAALDKTWLILVFHDIKPTLAEAGTYDTDTTTFQAIVNYLKDQSTLNTIKVKTVSQVIDDVTL